MAAGSAAGLVAGLVVGPVQPGAAAAQPAGLPTAIGALGDSITRGFNACGFYVDCLGRSWSTGDDPDVGSHRQRLKLAQGGAVDMYSTNVAQTGARAEALAGQARDALGRGARYVTIEIGANDACRHDVEAMTPVADYRRHVAAGLDVLAAEPEVRVFVASIPDLGRLWEVGHGSARVRYTWSKLRVCPSMLAAANSDAPADVGRRERVRQRVIAYNEVLAELCANFGSRCGFDGNAVFRTRFTRKELSPWDFFHPNARGQRRLAGVTWGAGLFGSSTGH